MIAASEPLLLGPHSLVDPPVPRPGSGRSGEAPTDASSFAEIVACVDGSELGSGVVPHAQLVARALGARLTLLHVLEAEPGDAGLPDSLDWEIRQREARAHLEALAAKVDDLESAQVRSELIQGRPAEQICDWADGHDVDLTVLCSHGARGVTEWDLASTARKLIDRIPRSLLLVPARVAARREKPHYTRILVPLDGSPRAESVVPVAMRIAAAERAELVFVHAVPVPDLTRTGPLDAEGVELERRVIEHNRSVASEYLDRIRARVRQTGIAVRARVVGNGDVYTWLERVILEEGADLVVMSAHGHTGRTDSACGSVTEHAVTHATTPLLVVRDPARRAMRRVGTSTARPRDRLASSDHASL